MIQIRPNYIWMTSQKDVLLPIYRKTPDTDGFPIPLKYESVDMSYYTGLFYI